MGHRVSNIPRARELLREIRVMTDLTQIRRQVTRAIGLMVREPPCRRASPRTVRITPALRRRVRSLYRSDLTIHEIANVTGLRNNGRVSEILNGRR